MKKIFLVFLIVVLVLLFSGGGNSTSALVVETSLSGMTATVVMEPNPDNQYAPLVSRIRVDGKLVPLGENQVRQSGPKWSPDSKYLAYICGVREYLFVSDHVCLWDLEEDKVLLLTKVLPGNWYEKIYWSGEQLFAICHTPDYMRMKVERFRIRF